MIAGMHHDSTFGSVGGRTLVVAGCATLMLVFVSLALAQEPPDAAVQNPPAQLQSPPAGDAPAQAQTPAPSLPTPPEVIGAIGRVIDQSISNVGAGMSAGVRGAGETLGATTSAAGELARGVTGAAGTMARLPLSNVVTGWQRCAIAANGAPDCQVASAALCQAKGYSTGNSVDITSARKCPAQVWLQGREPAEGECQDESFVSRAMCQ